MWDLPGPGLEPVSPALAGEFLTTAPPGKSVKFFFFKEILFSYLEIFLGKIISPREARSEAILHSHQCDSAQFPRTPQDPNGFCPEPQLNSQLTVDLKSISHHNMSTVYLPSLSSVLERETETSFVEAAFFVQTLSPGKVMIGRKCKKPAVLLFSLISVTF